MTEGKEINTSELSNEELLELMGKGGGYNEGVNKEWMDRHGLNIPYILHPKGLIFNCITDKVVKEEDCDRKILQQAEQEKQRRESIMSGLTMDSFIKECKRAIEDKDKNWMVVEISGVASKPEMIINPRFNFEDKIEYYSQTYTEDLIHKYNAHISISNYYFLEDLADIKED